MADAATTHLIQQTVLKYVAANTMFTAYDVTMEVRAQGAFVKHGEARDIVHQLFLDGVLGPQYQRSVVDIGTSTKPFVYHRFSEDARNYKSPGTGATSAAPANNPPAATPGIFQRVVSAVFGSGSAPAPPATGGSPAQSWTQTTRSAPPKQRKPIKLDLDASDYLPIARTVLLAKAKQTNVWGSPWFGRRDLIPPLDDDRTKLIDRAMVSQGIVAPEDLVEIHRVGAEMDLHRPAEILINRQSQKAGAEAVEEERQRRQAEKKEARRAEIVARKANDILFLGRGVSGQLGHRESDAAKLQSLQLPALSTPAYVATALSITIPQLRWLAFHNDVASRTHYVSFTIPKNRAVFAR
jgi:RNA-directed DNA polymerase